MPWFWLYNPGMEIAQDVSVWSFSLLRVIAVAAFLHYLTSSFNDYISQAPK